MFLHRWQRWFWCENNLWDCWENHPFQFGAYFVNIFVVEWIYLLVWGNLCSNFGFTICNLQATFVLWAHLSSSKSDQNKWCLNYFISVLTFMHTNTFLFLVMLLISCKDDFLDIVFLIIGGLEYICIEHM